MLSLHIFILENLVLLHHMIYCVCVLQLPPCHLLIHLLLLQLLILLCIPALLFHMVLALFVLKCEDPV